MTLVDRIGQRAFFFYCVGIGDASVHRREATLQKIRCGARDAGKAMGTTVRP
jgi:hypothetical protein